MKGENMDPKQNITLIKKSTPGVAMFTTGHIFSTLEDPLKTKCILNKDIKPEAIRPTQVNFKLKMISFYPIHLALT